MNAVERKQENDDRIKVLNEEHNTQEAQKGRERQHPIRQAQELLDISRSADFFEPDTSGTLHDAEKMESEAFAQLEEITPEERRHAFGRSELAKSAFVRAYAIRSRIFFDEKISSGMSHSQALHELYSEFDTWLLRAQNVPEIGRALEALRQSLDMKIRRGEEWDRLEGILTRVSSGEGSEADDALVRAFGRAVRGTYYREEYAGQLAEEYGIPEWTDLVRVFASRYKTEARQKIAGSEIDPSHAGPGIYNIGVNYPADERRPRRLSDDLKEE